MNIRTIQRVESGESVSLETLKSLASVFQVEVEELTEEIEVIDKESEKWKNGPWWVRATYWGVRSHRVMLWIEMTALFLGIAAVFLVGDGAIVPALLLAAYATGWTVRYGDSNELW